MSKYDLIAFDMDGTLLNSDKRIDPKTLKSIRKAASQGKYIALSTGRCLSELEEYLSELPDVRYIIAVSGALVYDRFEDRVVFSSELSPERVLSIFATAEKYDLNLQLMSRRTVIQRDRYDHLENYYMDGYRALYSKAADLPDDIRAYYKRTQIPIYKLNLFTRNEDNRQSLLKDIRSPELTIVFSEVTGLECTSVGIHKGLGLARLCDHLGIGIERAIAVGDADNDLDIIRDAGLGIAMGNANENVRLAADVIVSDNDHGGCSEAINTYLLAE